MSNEIVIFADGNVNIEVQVSPEQDTVWLNGNQIAELSDREAKKTTGNPYRRWTHIGLQKNSVYRIMKEDSSIT